MRKQRWTYRVRRGMSVVLYALLGWLLLATIQPVFAHGDGRVLQLTKMVGDNFYLTVWCAPSILRTGEIHIITAVNDAQDAPRADVLVQVELTPLEGDGELMTTLAYPIVDTASATTKNARDDTPTVLYEAAFVVSEPGRYQAQVNVVDATGASGAASFPITVVKVPLWFQGFLYLQLAMGAAVGLLLLRRGHQLWFGRRTQLRMREKAAMQTH